MINHYDPLKRLTNTQVDPQQVFATAAIHNKPNVEADGSDRRVVANPWPDGIAQIIQPIGK
jgi:hypothetical protein